MQPDIYNKQKLNFYNLCFNTLNEIAYFRSNGGCEQIQIEKEFRLSLLQQL